MIDYFSCSKQSKSEVKNSIFKLLETFSQEEWKACKNFLLAENKADSKVYKSFLYIYKHRSKTPDIDALHKKVMPSSSRKNMLNTISLLKGHIEDFLVYQHVMKEEMLKNTILHRELLFRNNLPEADKLREGTISELVKNERYNLRDQMYIHLFLHDMFFSNTEYKYKYGHDLLKKSSESLLNYKDFIELYYQIEKENHKSKNRDDKLLQEYSINGFNKNNQFIRVILQSLFKFSKVEEKEDFQVLFDQLEKWNIRESNELYSFSLLQAIEFCIKQYSYRADSSFIYYLLELYDLGLRKGVFFEKGFISSRKFNNFIDAACGVNRLEWAEMVIKKYGKRIEPEYKEDTLRFARAQVLMTKNRFQNALHELEELTLSLRDHSLKYRWCKLVCLLELNRLFEFDSLINSTTIYVKRNKQKMTIILYNGMLNYLSLIKKLRKGVDIDLLREELITKKNVIMKSWLIKKLEN